MRDRNRARWAIFATAALFSTGGAAIKATDLSGAQVSGLRTVIASLAFLALVPSARRLPSWREWLVGISYAGALVFYTLGNKLTTAANTIFLQSTAPLYILFLGPWLLRERVDKRGLVFLLVAAGGLSLFFLDVDAPQATAPNPLLGNLLGLASGLCWAFTLVGLRWLGSRGQSVSAVVAGNVIASAVCLPFVGSLAEVGARDWIALVWLGTFQVALAYVLLTKALRLLPAFEASILLLAEPMLNPVWAFVLHGEVPGRWALTGGGILLAATVVHGRMDRRRNLGGGPVLPTPGPRAPDRS
jgi:drug/metabolite transporter (DMT)-like permease